MNSKKISLITLIAVGLLVENSPIYAMGRVANFMQTNPYWKVAIAIPSWELSGAITGQLINALAVPDANSNISPLGCTLGAFAGAVLAYKFSGVATIVNLAEASYRFGYKKGYESGLTTGLSIGLSQ